MKVLRYYTYKAKTAGGKVTKGKISSENKQEALNQLKRAGLIVFDIQQLNTLLHKDIYIGKPVKNKDFVIFLRQFSTLIDAGIALVEATEILAEQTNSKPLKQALREIKDEMREGRSLSEAMADHSRIFPELLISMVSAGEISGRLDEILDRMATYFEKQYELKQKIRTALTYPAVIGTVSVFITLFLLAFIVPVFTDMFISFDQDIPAYTQAVLNISAVFQTYWWLLLLFISVILISVKGLNKQEKVAYFFDGVKLKLPIFGSFIQKAALARFSQTLSTLLNSSVPIIEAVEITERIMTNRVIKDVLKSSRQALEEGESLAKPMTAHWVFPKLLTQMVAVGEATGALDQMLQKVSYFYEQELEEASDKLKSLIEPVMIIFLAVVVGAIVLAIVIPMFSLFESI